MAKTVKGKAEVVKPAAAKVEAYDGWEVWTRSGNYWVFFDEADTEDEALETAEKSDSTACLIHITIPAIK